MLIGFVGRFIKVCELFLNGSRTRNIGACVLSRTVGACGIHDTKPCSLPVAVTRTGESSLPLLVDKTTKTSSTYVVEYERITAHIKVERMYFTRAITRVYFTTWKQQRQPAEERMNQRRRKLSDTQVLGLILPL